SGQFIGRSGCESILQGWPWPKDAFSTRPLETRHISLGGSPPCCAPRVKIGALPHRMPLGVVVQQSDCRLRDGSRIVEGNQDAASIGKQFLRVPVGRRDDRLPCSQSNCQRAGNNLRFLPVWSDVDVRSADVFYQLLRTDKTIIENDLRRNP